MANYNSLKNASVLAKPVSNTDLGSTSNRYGNIYLSGNINMNGTTVNSTNILPPKVTSITYPGDDTAADTAGGQSVILSGSGFASGASVLINGTTAPSVTYVNSTTMSFVTPAMSAGTYTLYVVNTDGGVAINIPGISYSGTPAWTTAAGSLGTNGQGSSVSYSLATTGDAPITYAVTSGSLPAGLSLNTSTGAITGTAPNPVSTTTYNFTVTATDAQNQSTDRAFSITISTFVSASGGTVTTVGNYKIHTFTTSGTFTVSSGGNIEYLLIGGGGAGGTGYYGGGGGAGGFLYNTTSFDGGSYSITVGSGGTGQTNQALRGGNGANTTVLLNSFNLTAYGGGGGGSRNNDAAGGNAGGANGGSGGGAAFPSSAGGKGVYPSSTYVDAPRQGYDGGTNPSGQFAAGGGGAGGRGKDGTTDNSRAGGAGLANPISGSTAGELSGGTYYLAGGGGGGYTYGYAGLGGGGATSAGPGTPNTGGGGAGGFSNNDAGGAGGSGIVIFRYQFQ